MVLFNHWPLTSRFFHMLSPQLGPSLIFRTARDVNTDHNVCKSKVWDDSWQRLCTKGTSRARSLTDTWLVLNVVNGYNWLLLGIFTPCYLSYCYLINVLNSPTSTISQFRTVRSRKKIKIVCLARAATQHKQRCEIKSIERFRLKIFKFKHF